MGRMVKNNPFPVSFYSKKKLEAAISESYWKSIKKRENKKENIEAFNHFFGDKMKELMLYKIRNLITNKYSSGGSRYKWHKDGKIWNNIGSLKNHLQIAKYNLNEIEVVQFSLKECKILPIADLLIQIKENRDKKELKRRQKQKEYEIQCAEEEFERAKQNLQKLKR